jgi:DNA repair exonuclease SbcCD ATPase subunit
MVLAKELAEATEAGTVAAGQIGSLLTTVEVKEAEREELRVKFSSLLEDKDKQLNEFRERYHDLRENIQTVRRSNETTVAEVIAELKTAEAEANLLRSRIRELEQTQRSMENTLAAETSNFMALQDENGTLKLRITALQDEIGARQLKIEQQERDIGIKNCRIEGLSDDMKRLENEMRSELYSTSESFRAQKEGLRAELQTTSESWRMKCNHLQQELEKESATLQAALQREKELQDALKRELAVFLFLSFLIWVGVAQKVELACR